MKSKWATTLIVAVMFQDALCFQQGMIGGFRNVAKTVCHATPSPTELASLPLPPGKLGLPLLSDHTFKFAKEGSAHLSTLHQKWGDIVQVRMFFTKAVVVTGIENLRKLWLAEHELVEAEVPSAFAPILGEKGIFMTKGDAHKRLKQQLAKAFSPAAVSGYLPAMQSLTEDFCDKWAKSGTILGVDSCKDLAFAIILDVVMGFERDLWSNEVSSQRLKSLYADVQGAMFAPPINLPGSAFRKALDARKQLLVDIEESVQRVAAQRGPSEEGRARNVASILLSATDEDGERLTMEQIKDVCFNMLDAGQDTTGYTLAAILAALARDPGAVAALAAEQSSVLALHGAALTDAALRAMPYADAVIKEALRNASPEPTDRMRSITVINVKKALVDFELGGYRIPAGTTIIGNAAYASHTDPRWEGLEGTPMDKRRFCPARWLTDAGRAGAGAGAGASASGTFAPFAAGPRACIGSTLATAELKVALAVLIRGYSWRLADAAAAAGGPLKWKSDPFPFPLDRLPLAISRRVGGLPAPAAATGGL